MNIIRLWKNRNQIIEGVKNSIFKKEDVEEIAKERGVICSSNKCASYDVTGVGCMVPGTQPCCSVLTGGCGCSLKFKLRSLSSFCPKGYWDIVLNEDEEQQLKEKLGIND
ncbi:MAG TPA: hypothetical protein VGM30_10655 [Puia sp.]|jgi:hypothetical protein